MKIVFIKKRWLYVFFGALITFAIFYMAYQISNLPANNKSIPSEVELEVVRLKNKLLDLENKANYNKKNLEKIDEYYKMIAGQKKKLSESSGGERNKEIFEDRPKQVDEPKELPIYIEKPTTTSSSSTSTTTSTTSEIVKIKAPEKNVTIFMDTCDWLGDSKSPAEIQMSALFENLPFDDIDGGVWKQGFDITYESTQWNSDSKLHIIVVPHSHNDPGWIMTFEQYFLERTKYILDTIVNSLSENVKRKFVWAETSYLSLWWNHQANVDMKNKMRRLILETKQLEIVTGGWVMTDEANSNYYAMIEEMIEGHEWLKANIDESIRPTYGWSIDPFGYSPTMAYLLNKMGFEAMVIQRVHYHIKKYFAKSLRFEFKWAQSWSTKNSQDTSILCHVMPFYSYDIPHTCGPDPKICCQFDFKRMNGKISCPWGIMPQTITESNVKERAELLLDQYRKRSQLYGDKNNHNVILVPLGDDFRYTDMEEANAQFENYQRLMDYLNSNKYYNVDIKFGTLSDYFRLLNEQNTKVGKKMETFTGDFFTYADRQDHYWSGYFTSRPFAKRLDRLVEAYLRSAEIAFSLSNLIQSNSNNKFKSANDLYKKLLISRRNLGLFQHHDGITGTSKTPVVKDYANKLYESLKNCREIIEKSTSYLLDSSLTKNSDLTFNLDDISLISNNEYKSHFKPVINLEQSNEQKIVLFNSNMNKRNELVKLKVNSPNVEVLDSEGKPLTNVQTSLIWPNTELEYLDQEMRELKIKIDVEKLSHALNFDDKYYELIFEVELKSLSFETFTIRKRDASQTYVDQLSKVTFVQDVLNPNNVDAVKSSIRERLETIPYIKEMNPIEFNQTNKEENDDTMIKIKVDENYMAHFSSQNGFLQKLVPINAASKTLKSKFKIIKYGTTNAHEKSGAYLFLPDDKATSLGHGLFQWIKIDRGNLRIRVCVNMTLVLHCVEFYPTISKIKELKYPMFGVWNVVDLRSSHNTELAMHFETDIDNQNTLHTDLNGFQFIKRKTYSKLTIQGNVYPMPTAAFIQDKSLRLNVLTAQPLGAASLENSAIQVFLDRRLDQDDNRGMEQAMNDNILTPSKFLMFFEELTEKSDVGIDNPSLMLQLLSYDLLNPVVKLISTSTTSSNMLPRRGFLNEKKQHPCDLRLINMRSMQTKNEEPLSNEVGLILHRVVLDDCKNNQLIQLPRGIQNTCTSDEAKSFSFEDLFNFNNDYIKNMRIKNTYLTLAPKDNTSNSYINTNDALVRHIQPMQIEAFRIKF